MSAGWKIVEFQFNQVFGSTTRVTLKADKMDYQNSRMCTSKKLVGSCSRDFLDLAWICKVAQEITINLYIYIYNYMHTAH